MVKREAGGRLFASIFIVRVIKEFREYMQPENEDQCLDDQMKMLKTDGDIKAQVEAMMNGEPIRKLLGWKRQNYENPAIREAKV
jgi:hypothetical protein